MDGMTKLQPKDEGSLDPGMLNAALEAFPLGLAIAEKGRILYANRGFAQRFGLARVLDIHGAAVEEFVPELNPDLRTAGDSGKDKNRARGQIPASVAEFKVNGRNLLVISASETGQGARPELQSSESQKMEAIGRLVSGVTHDFNNLLTGIMLYCDLLLLELKEHSPSWHHAEAIRMAGQHGAALIQQLMAVARHEDTEPRLFSWNYAILDMRNLLDRLIGENIKLVTELSDDLGLVKMDYACAQQIILNLVLNARDAMPEGGQIKLSTNNGSKASMHLAGKDPGAVPYIEFVVSDTGHGMDKETREHVFERFFTTKKPGHGTGLGLATVYDLIQQMEGTIDIVSAIEKGTRVVIHLPRVKEEPKDIAAAAPVPPKI